MFDRKVPRNLPLLIQFTRCTQAILNIYSLMNNFDVEYDFRLDSHCGDPDTDSPKLYELHSILWNREFPNREVLKLNVLYKSYGRLILKTNLTDNLSSDRMCPHLIGKYNGRFDNWLNVSEKEKFQQKVRTIGGHIIFPAHRKNGFTINQSRGINRKISDRFDLTLECIRRFYNDEDSPLKSTLDRYSDFFRIFDDFTGYVKFFLLQDFVNREENVEFTLPFDDFHRSALPLNKKEYISYMNLTIEQIDKRNVRILELQKSHRTT